VRVHVCLLSSNAGANEVVRKKQAALIPPSIRAHERFTAIGADFGASVFDPRTQDSSLEEYLLDRYKTTDFLVLLVDEELCDIAETATPACFVGRIRFETYPPTNFVNYLTAVLAKLLKNFALFLPFICDGAKEQVMLLPFRTFDARELQNLRDICTNALVQNFINSVNGQVEALRNRRRPHRKSGYDGLYYVDDQDRLFDYGLEQHAQLATGEPHNKACILLGSARFGRKIPLNRHYNVTKEKRNGTKIEGTFLDCHDAPYTVSPTTHLNVFSNDYRT
jgi:hypothetical protein